MTLLNGKRRKQTEQTNGNGHNQTEQRDGTKPSSQPTTKEAGGSSSAPANSDSFAGNFDHSVVLRQSPIWAQAAIGTIIAVVTFGVGWAFFAKMEQAVSARGQLKPKGEVKEVQAPSKGVVEEVHVEDGERVDKGELLLSFDSKTAAAELKSLQNVRQSLMEENKFYRNLMQQPSSPTAVQQKTAQLDLPPEVASLAKNRAALTSENQLYRKQLGMGTQTANLGADELARLQAATKESRSRTSAAELKVEQLKQQQSQTQVKLANAQEQLGIERDILSQLQSLVKEGAVAQLKYIKQKQAVQDRASKVDTLQAEQQRLQLDISQAQKELTKTTAGQDKAVLDQIAANKQQIAKIDSQLSKAMMDNRQRISELDSQISQAQQQLKYKQLRAPAAGAVFDLQPGYDSVASPSETLLKIVPSNKLIAKVNVSNQDIGFVEEGMKVDVRIDTFPFSQYGDIEGEVISIGSDALPPDKNHDSYRYPAKIRLDEQSLSVNDREIALQSGMSVSANIIVREDRHVIDLFTERFTSAVDSLKNVR